eukprot:1482143-Rhodomonas_salina.1
MRVLTWGHGGARSTHFALQPAPGSFCADHARYALYSSCVVPVSKQQAFAVAVDTLVQQGHGEALCTETVPAHTQYHCVHSVCTHSTSSQQPIACGRCFHGHHSVAFVETRRDCSEAETHLCGLLAAERRCLWQTLREELHAEDSGVAPTPATAAPNPDGSPVNFDCYDSKCRGMITRTV